MLSFIKIGPVVGALLNVVRYPVVAQELASYHGDYDGNCILQCETM
jgi:hypothetical protein